MWRKYPIASSKVGEAAEPVTSPDIGEMKDLWFVAPRRGCPMGDDWQNQWGVMPMVRMN